MEYLSWAYGKDIPHAEADSMIVMSVTETFYNTEWNSNSFLEVEGGECHWLWSWGPHTECLWESFYSRCCARNLIAPVVSWL